MRSHENTNGFREKALGRFPSISRANDIYITAARLTPLVPLTIGDPGSEVSPDVRIDRTLRDLVQPGNYERWEYFSRQRLLATAMSAVLRPPGRILDIGCGYGALALTMSEGADLDVVAMDILEERVSSVQGKIRTRDRKAGSGIRLLRANAEKGLPFRPDSFDGAVATEVLEHLDDPGRMLQEAHRVLRPGGRLFLTTPNADALPYRILRHLPPSAVRKLAGSLTRSHLHPDLMHSADENWTPGHPDQHRREGFTLSELDSLAASSGLRTLKLYTYRIPLPDRIMNVTPRRLARPLAVYGTRPMPFGLQVYAEFVKPEESR